MFRRLPAIQVEPAQPLVLNREQQEAFEGLDQLRRSGQPAAALLYGVTGSGKTQIYIRLIQEIQKAGENSASPGAGDRSDTAAAKNISLLTLGIR